MSKGLTPIENMDGMKYEEKLLFLQEIVEKMQEGNVDLEESLHLYENGIGLYRRCLKELEDMEMKIKTISMEVEEQRESEEGQ